MSKNNLLIAILFFILVISLKFSILNTPYHWDDNEQILLAELLRDNNFNPLLLRGFWFYEGHPLFFFELLALCFSIFGESLFISHLVVVVFTFIAVYFTYLLGKYIYNKKIGFISALFSFFCPIFFAQSGTISHSVPLTALILITLYFMFKKKVKSYLISGIICVMTFEPAILLFLLITIFIIYENYESDKFKIVKKILIYSIPSFVFGLWLLLNKLIFGKYFNPTFPGWSGLYEIGFISFSENLYFRLNEIFSYDYRWILTLSLIIYSIKVLTTKELKFKKEPIFLFLIILSYLAAFSLIKYLFLLRYALMVYPLFFILASNSLYKIFKNKLILSIFVLIILILFISKWTGKRTLNCGCYLEENLEYLDLVETHYEGAKYIENNFPNSTVLTNWPQHMELSMPEYGYVNKSIKFVAPDDPDLNEKISEVDLLYYSPQSDDFSRWQLDKIMNNLNLTLLKKFEKNGKITEIYRIKH